ncbi:MAG: phosphogluconate dehydrogenase (NADP(+)-dependent, decarboxylating) [Burkholderiales bacterium PBB5]|nr:MAG: phosphogluconate dehydrogenase (NADP(+)-dependent, decarboxylating) [Burkholderiales bacterium PBB5]
MPGHSDFGLIGLAVMGQNLVLNVESRGFAVSVYNRSPEVTQAFVARHPGKAISGFDSLAAFVASLSRPRKVMVMVKAGAAVDAVIEQLIPLLDKDDIVIDGGNSLYTDTERRDAWLSPLGLRFVGAGVSGGEEGARKGPAIMPGGPASTWAVLRPIFEAIAAKVDGEPCVVHIGPGGAGHYVKMIHNGIEYGDMQLICEAYSLLKAAGLSTDEMAAVFARWNEGELQSYLIEITAKALAQRDAETGQPVVDLILQKDQRMAASQLLQGPPAVLSIDRATLVQQVHDALYASKIVSYAQGLDLMRTMGERKAWALDLGAIARIWRGGCIIRARFLNRITEAYAADPALTNLMLAPFFQDVLNRSQAAWRQVVASAVGAGIPVPAFSASLAYFDSLRTARLSANLLQAQRDFFGAHTYERVDKPAGQWFHTDWPEVID